jgi:hypothetical protein
MAQAAPGRTKIPTETPQLLHSGPARRVGRPKTGNRTALSWVIASGTGRATTRGSGEVIELECGITVYPAREEHGRWRAVWYENGERRQCEAASEAKLAARLEKVAERLEADAPNMSRPGADLIAHYLDPGRMRPPKFLPAGHGGGAHAHPRVHQARSFKGSSQHCLAGPSIGIRRGSLPGSSSLETARIGVLIMVVLPGGRPIGTGSKTRGLACGR